MTAIDKINFRANIVRETYASFVRQQKRLDRVAADASEKIEDFHQIAQPDYAALASDPGIADIVGEWRGLQTALEFCKND